MEDGRETRIKNRGWRMEDGRETRVKNRGWKIEDGGWRGEKLN
jgi:hypothetical protein